jgi:hypothetical protein
MSEAYLRSSYVAVESFIFRFRGVLKESKMSAEVAFKPSRKADMSHPVAVVVTRFRLARAWDEKLPLFKTLITPSGTENVAFLVTGGPPSCGPGAIGCTIAPELMSQALQNAHKGHVCSIH